MSGQLRVTAAVKVTGPIADGKAPLPTTAPRGSDVLTQPLVFARIHGYLSMATSLLWLRQQDTFGVLGLEEPGPLAPFVRTGEERGRGLRVHVGGGECGLEHAPRARGLQPAKQGA